MFRKRIKDKRGDIATDYEQCRIISMKMDGGIAAVGDIILSNNIGNCGNLIEKVTMPYLLPPGIQLLKLLMKTCLVYYPKSARCCYVERYHAVSWLYVFFLLGTVRGNP